jgi:hypothetical protein
VQFSSFFFYKHVNFFLMVFTYLSGFTILRGEKMVFFNKQVVPGMELSGAETGRGEQKAAHWELSRSQAPAGNAIFYIKLYSEKFALCMGQAPSPALCGQPGAAVHRPERLFLCAG